MNDLDLYKFVFGMSFELMRLSKGSDIELAFILSMAAQLAHDRLAQIEPPKPRRSR